MNTMCIQQLLTDAPSATINKHLLVYVSTAVMLVLGVTGGICSGKSTVARILHENGATIIDADKLGHRTYERGTACYTKLIEHFGDSIVDEQGEINRRVLGTIVFSSPEKMKELQNIVWPEIRNLIVSGLEELKAQGVKVVVLEAAVMIEAGWQDLVSTLWVISVNKDVALKRLMTRNSLSEADALNRINAQIGNEERGSFANLVIDNSDDDSMQAFEDKVKSAYNSLLLV